MCCAARAATWGRCVMQITCRCSPRRVSRSPIMPPLRPPSPTSTSSKTISGTTSLSPKTALIANVNRAVSPPEATRCNGRVGASGLKATSSRTLIDAGLVEPDLQLRQRSGLWTVPMPEAVRTQTQSAHWATAAPRIREMTDDGELPAAASLASLTELDRGSL